MEVKKTTFVCILNAEYTDFFLKKYINKIFSSPRDKNKEIHEFSMHIHVFNYTSWRELKNDLYMETKLTKMLEKKLDKI